MGVHEERAVICRVSFSLSVRLVCEHMQPNEVFFSYLLVFMFLFCGILLKSTLILAVE